MKPIKTFIHEILQYLFKATQLPGAYCRGLIVPYDNYIYKDNLTEDSLIIDVGCADDPDLSLFMMNKYGLNAIAIDPTEKHKNALRNIENTIPNFKFMQYAISNISGKITFHESLKHRSGSLLIDHTNVKKDKIITYEVDSITLLELAEIIGKRVNLLKLDLEGAEYELLENVTKNDLMSYDQIFVEFHHHCTEYTKLDTKGIVSKLEAFGFKSYTVNTSDYLFYRS